MVITLKKGGVKRGLFFVLLAVIVCVGVIAAANEVLPEKALSNGLKLIAEKFGPAQIDYEERVKNVRGSLFSVNETVAQAFEKLVGSEKQKLSVELVESVTSQGTHLKINSTDAYIPSGGTSYIGGWLIRHRGNIASPNGTIYSNIDTFYIGLDTDCGLADHYECINGSLHWLYCNGTDYGVVEECDACGNNECIKKGTSARWEKMRAYREIVSKLSE